AELFEAGECLRRTQAALIEGGRASALAGLSSGILHQISQPLTVIYGFVRYMKEEIKEGDKFYKPVSMMETQAVELKKKLDNLTELVSHRKIVKTPVDVNEVIKQAMGLVTDEFKKRRIKWLAELNTDVPKVNADGVLLQQAFMILAINSAESLEGRSEEAIRYFEVQTAFDKDQNEVTVSFSDNGPGINEKDKKSIFTPFFTTKKNSLGIGLALCKNLAEEHSGNISFHSEKGAETVFTVRLPALK
ncbi:MAG: hypothetical protein HQL27_08640, partial [Candidatus Omnitrophica bacterium]|nr:hypothetical protein [Candidatus Omnitrophota bacterium]